MKLRSWFSCALIFAASLPALAAQKYSAIYVFGDSYVDTGNIYAATKGATPPSPPYYKGRFSNGPLWIEHLAGSFNLQVAPSTTGGTDFAFGGAQLLQDVVVPGGIIPSVPHQVELYLAATHGKADPNALYVLEGGGNDILAATSGSPADLGFRIGAGLAALEIELRAAGATHFLVPNLFDIGFLPAGRANFAFDTAATIAANKELADVFTTEKRAGGVTIYSPDIFSLANSINNDKTHFGFTEVLTPCLNPATGAPCANPDRTLFWDDEHLTEFGQTVLAVASEAYVHP